MKYPSIYFQKLVWLPVLFFGFGIGGCQPSEPMLNEGYNVPLATDASDVITWDWSQVHLPAYNWPDGTAFGNGLYTDVIADPQGVSIENGRMRFFVNPVEPPPPIEVGSPFNYRSEIRTAPWNIEHPIGTEQWLGWRYHFGDNYQIDPTAPITIFQNHPGVVDQDPLFELEIAAFGRPEPALGGEIQVVNAANNDRIIYPVRPKAGGILDVVVHVIYGHGTDGLLQVWLNGELHHWVRGATIYKDYPWGGNNKWGIYHHTFNNSPDDVATSLDAGIESVEIYMGNLKMLTRTADHPEYETNAYQLVKPN